MTADEMIGMLSEARVARGWTLADIERRAGYDRKSFSKWETGLVAPSLRGFVDWANSLGYDVKLEKCR
jgi:transcriptional regulator with XRE-family HTH domain